MSASGTTEGPSVLPEPSGASSRKGTRAGEPAPPGSYDGRARSFREQEAARRREFRDRVEVVIVVVIIALGILAIVTAHPFIPSSGSNFPTPGPPITVNLTKTSRGNVTCGSGGTAYTEQVVYASPSPSVTTGDIAPRLYEAFDLDILPDVGVVANVSSTSLCAGSPPSGAILVPWYVVLVAPNGTIQLSYTFAQGWRSVTNGAWNFPIENGTSFIVVTSFALPEGTYGFAVVGYVGGSSVRGTCLL